MGTLSGMIVLLFIVLAILAEVLAPLPHNEVNILDRMQEPSDRMAFWGENEKILGKGDKI